MPHFYVDDHFHSHRKRRRSSLEAIGLWTAAGSWCRDVLSDGFVPRSVVEGFCGRRTKAVTQVLVAAVLWHPYTEDGEEGWLFHDWAGPCPICKPEADDPTAGHQTSREQVLAAKRRNADRQKRFRDRSSNDDSDGESNALRDDSSNDATDTVSNTAQARPGQTPKHLLTLVSRLAAGDVGPPPAEMIDAWQDLAGPDVDLEAEAAAYLIRHGDRPARDPRGAWLGWLTKARDRADAARPAPPKPPCPEPDCADGWITTEDPDHPRPCPQCRPHLRLAQEAS